MRINSRRPLGYFPVGFLLASFLAACGGGGGGSSSSASPTISGTNDAPTISGTPVTTTVALGSYSFTPTTEDVDGDTLTFSIQNPPAWASFDPATGALTGNPGNTDVGITSGIVISVSDDIAAPVALAAFDLWVVVNECLSGFFDWGVGIDSIGVSPDDYTPQAYQQTGDCRGFTQEGVEIGTYSLLFDVPIAPAGMDLRLRVLADDTGNPADWINGAIGVMFGFDDNDNYYRVDISGLEGHRKLWKRVAGVFTELNTSPQSYTLGKWFNLRIVHENGVILVYMDGEKIMAVEDATFSGARIALFCARNESCSFDNVFILDPPSAPIVGMNIADSVGHKSGEYFVSGEGILDISAVVNDETDVGGVEFVVDEGSAGDSAE